MAVSVVHELEVVEVDVEDRQAAAGTAGVGDRPDEMLVERGPVGQVREAVVIGEVLEARSRLPKLVGGPPALGDVGDDAVHPNDPILDARPRSLPHPPGHAVEPDEPELDLRRLALPARLGELRVGLTVVGMHGLLPRRLLVHAGGDGPEQARQTLADEGGALIRAVLRIAQLVEMDGRGSGDTAEHVAGRERGGQSGVQRRVGLVGFHLPG